MRTWPTLTPVRSSTDSPPSRVSGTRHALTQCVHCGRYLGGGLPFGAFGGTAKWMARHDPKHPQTVASGGTFNQNALSMAAAVAVLEELWTPEICVAHNARCDAFREELNRISAAHGGPCQAVGTGSLMTIAWQSQARPFLRPSDLTVDVCYLAGVYSAAT